MLRSLRLYAFILTLVSITMLAWAQGSTLHIGTTDSLSTSNKNKDKAALDTLHNFIREETGMSNDIASQKDWKILAERMAKGDIQVGVFTGIEFAWALEKYPGLKPMAIAVNVHRYPQGFVIVKNDSPAKDFASLQGKSVSVCMIGHGFLRVYMNRESHAFGQKTPADFFSKIVEPENDEDSIDAVLDGKVESAIADQTALEAYRRRKPGRFKLLKSIAQTPIFPAPVVACYQAKLDESSINRFRDGLVNANRKERGETILTMFRLSGFETIPSDFANVLNSARKAFPSPSE